MKWCFSPSAKTAACLASGSSFTRPSASPPGRPTIYLREAEAGVLNGQEVARAAYALKQSGFVPDVMLGHNGWGEIWYLKDIYPTSPLIGYFEFFYRAEGADIEFEPGISELLDTAPRLRTRNVGNLLGLEAADLGQCPTRWQQSLYPERYRSMLRVVHEGVDTRIVKPNPTAKLRLPDGSGELSSAEEVVTYVSRNLEPYRGFQSLMRSLPAILSRRPKAHVVIVGGDAVSYGMRLPEGKTYRGEMLKELGDSLDLARVHFLGRVPYPTFRGVRAPGRIPAGTGDAWSEPHHRTLTPVSVLYIEKGRRKLTSASPQEAFGRRIAIDTRRRGKGRSGTCLRLWHGAPGARHRAAGVWRRQPAARGG